ncbi:MAG TPA: cytochrome c oxidase subunit II [Abditibacteriaceae bacterium]|jgi:cytochrome c oxidase subunit 2
MIFGNDMQGQITLWPQQASTIAGSIDGIIHLLNIVTLVFTLGIFIAMLYFVVRYRRGAKVDRSNPPLEHHVLEITWSVIPLLICLVIFGWATVVYYKMKIVPKDAMEIYVVGKQWMWKLQHPEGRWEMNTLTVPKGRNVKLTMTSEDVIHSFFIPEFRVKQDVIPGRYTQLWFNATKTGTFRLFCAEFCGTDHSRMIGKVNVLEPAEYESWLQTGNVNQSLSVKGEQLFRQHGCSGCHGANSNVRAPYLEGLYGAQRPIQIPRDGVPLERIPGRVITADNRYIHDSIVLPNNEVAAGFKPIMPSYKGKLNEEEIVQLIEYIKTLKTSNGTNNGSNNGGIVGYPGGAAGSNKRTGNISADDVRSRTGINPAPSTVR